MKKRILLAEEAPAVAPIFEEKLLTLNVEVVVANNDGIALKHLQEGPQFDLIITDLVLPRVQGIPFVFLTNHVADSVAQKLGPDLILIKPVEPGDLQKIIENILF